MASEGSGTGVSRRGLLATAVAAPVALLAGCGGGLTTEVHLGRAPAPAPDPSAPPASPSLSPSPPPPAAQARPVFTLSDYRDLVPGPAFPAHAIALTIDDGPHPVWTPKVLRLLDRYQIPATFCMIGNQVLGHESVARSVSAAGHQIANHTYTHYTSLSKLSPEKMHSEIERAQDKIYSTTGYAPRLFRSPGGAWSAALARQTADAGLVSVDWSDDPRDWSRPGTAAITRALLAARPGQILLCHDGGGDRSQTYQALSKVIPTLLARGFVFVAL